MSFLATGLASAAAVAVVYAGKKRIEKAAQAHSDQIRVTARLDAIAFRPAAERS